MEWIIRDWPHALREAALEGNVRRSRVDPTVQHSDDYAFWCQHTFKCLGPDGQAVGKEECVPGRACYEEL